MKKSLQSAITTWVTAAIVLTVGILCIVAQNADGNAAGNAYDAISIVLGVTLIVVSTLGLVLNILVLKRAASAITLANGIILALGIYLVVEKTAAGLLYILTDYAAYVLTVVGALFVCDAILVLVFGLVKKADVKTILVPVCVEAIIGAVALVLGILALPSVNVIDKRLTIFGIILIVYALFLVLVGVFTFLGKSVRPEKKNDAIDAKAEDAKPEATEAKEE
ncbi:MAG: hypothetical protein II508_00005 [Acholeplasmatales bacterium]|jgi:hypothetical protein|nr:hypothetical protein [Acholeplasmatales bacterium]MBQ4356468.1 hypothetical protein [Acholeplasmatales bacterium]